MGEFWLAKYAKFLPVDNEDSNQSAHPRSLIRVFVVHICQKVRFTTLRLVLRSV